MEREPREVRMVKKYQAALAKVLPQSDVSSDVGRISRGSISELPEPAAPSMGIMLETPSQEARRSTRQDAQENGIGQIADAEQNAPQCTSLVLPSLAGAYADQSQSQ